MPLDIYIHAHHRWGVDNDDGSAYYWVHDNFFIYGDNGLKSDFGGHDNRHLHSVYVWVNNWLARDLAMPFGGWKESGNGQRSGGLFDVDFFTYSKTTCVEITGRHAITGKAYA